MSRIDMNISTIYSIYIAENSFKDFEEEFFYASSSRNLFVITDSNVAKLYQKKFEALFTNHKVSFVVVEPGEQSKSVECYLKVIEELLAKGITRTDLLVAFGGGVVGDLTGFIAATLFRGMDYVQIPTTLIAQVDSSIGGKTGIDFNETKNVIGAFKQPILVLIDPAFLKTLPKRELKAGYGEMIKHAMIDSPKLLDLLNTNNGVTEEIIETNIYTKKHFVEDDEYDQDSRMMLNFGHTFGHIIELQNNMLHGEAVLSGMLCSVDLGIDIGITPASVKTTLLDLYKKLGLNYKELDYHDYLKDVYKDKKNKSGILRLVLLEDIASPRICPFSEDELCKL